MGPSLVAQVSPTETSPFGGLKVAQVHAAASRTAAENKQAFLKLKRAQRGWGNDRATMKRSFTFKPGEAPDMADLDIYGEWQWAINIARGSADFAGSAPGAVARNGNIDYARLRIQPAKGTFAEEKMKWGLRRYNLGDTTVVDCDFTGIPEEHGIYDALAGHALYLGNTFLNLGGQGIQIAHRDRPFQQYKADNLEYAAPPLIIVDDCHAVDCGKFAARSGFTWTFFDPGNPKMPGTVIVRGSTSVHAWDFGRTTGGDAAEIDAPDAIRAPGGLVVQHYRARMEGEPETYATKALVVDRCVFDHTKSAMPIMAIRGVETILIEDSCFIARGCKIPFVDIDDLAGQPSGKVILQNCVSPEGSLVQLRIDRKVVTSMNCPGKRVEIDVATRSVRILDPKDEPLTRVIHPLGGRVVEPGIHPQPGGHVDALGSIEVPALGAGD